MANLGDLCMAKSSLVDTPEEVDYVNSGYWHA